MKKFFGRKRSIALALVAVLAISAGAVAYWTTGGSGTGTASTDTTSNVTFTQTSTPSGMYPGGPTKPLDFTITNPGTSAVKISKVAVSVDSVSPAGCANSNYIIGNPSVTVGQTIAPGVTTSTITGANIKLDETGVNQDVCKGATVTVRYTVDNS
jgi:hypothetical protein